MKHGADHSAHLNRLKRIEGQIRGLQKMVSDQVYCVKLLEQMKATRMALKSLEEKILEEHLHHCVKESMHKDKIDEVIKLLKGR